MWRQSPGERRPGQPKGRHKACSSGPRPGCIVVLAVGVAVGLQMGVLHLVQGATRQGQGSSREPPTVNIPGQGKISGREVPFSRTQKATVYLNIPFAEPPVGHLRFSRPKTEHLPSWSGVRNGSSFGPACMQDLQNLYKMDKIFTSFYNQTIEISEDCLSLNVFVPDGTAPTHGWPVMLWFHSGDFNTGAACLWDGSVLAVRQKVIVVTTAYRLNVFGFFTTLDSNAAGNWGLWDQKAAIKWVKDKIRHFKGNGELITIFGHGAGAVSVGIHMISKESIDFQGAIALSGSSASLDYFMTIEDQANKVRALSGIYGCDQSTNATVPCLRNINRTALLTDGLSAGNGKWGPVLDITNVADPTRESYFLSDMPDQLLQEKGSAVPFITGFANHEDAFKVEEVAATINDDILRNLIREEIQKEVINPTQAYKNDNSDSTPGTFQQGQQEDYGDYPDSDLESTSLATPNDTCSVSKQPLHEAAYFYYNPIPKTNDSVILKQIYAKFLTDKKYGSSVYKQAYTNSKNKNTYLYRFDYRIKSQKVGSDVPDWAGVPHQYELPFVWGSPYSSLFKTEVLWNSADKKISDTVMAMFGSFARSVGTPSTAGPGSIVKWEPFKQDYPSLLIIDKALNMSDQENVDFRAFDFWVSYYPTVRDSLRNCCKNNSAAATLNFHTRIPLPFIPEFFVHISLLLTLMPFYTNTFCMRT